MENQVRRAVEKRIVFSTILLALFLFWSALGLYILKAIYR
jgi:hypothetical protein